MLGNLHVRFGVGAGVKLHGLHHALMAQYASPIGNNGSWHLWFVQLARLRANWAVQEPALWLASRESGKSEVIEC